MTLIDYLIFVFITFASGVAATIFFKKKSGESLKELDKKIAKADSLNEQIEKLKEESTRDTDLFKSRLADYRKRFPSKPRNGDNDPRQ